MYVSSITWLGAAKPANRKRVSRPDVRPTVGLTLFVQTRWTKVSTVPLRRRQPSNSSYRSAVDYVQGKMGGGDQVSGFEIQTSSFVDLLHSRSPMNPPLNKPKTSRSVTPFVEDTRTSPVPNSPSVTNLEMVCSRVYFGASYRRICISSLYAQNAQSLIDSEIWSIV